MAVAAGRPVDSNSLEGNLVVDGANVSEALVGEGVLLFWLTEETTLIPLFSHTVVSPITLSIGNSLHRRLRWNALVTVGLLVR